MKKLFLFFAAFAAFASTACSDDDNGGNRPADKYRGGFYVVNEGQYGKDPASVNYYDGQTWSTRIFNAANPDVALGATGSVGVCDTRSMYIVSKGAPFLVKVGLSDFVCDAVLSGELGTNAQACSFALIDKTRGVLTSTAGAYAVDLETLALGDRFCDSNCGDVCVCDGHIFLVAGSVIKAYDAQTLAEEKSDLCAGNTGFAEAGGALWCGNGGKLMKINTLNLTSEELALGDGVAVGCNAWAFTPSCLHASKKGDALFFSAPSGWNNKDIYKYTISNGAVEKFFSAPDNFSLYGCGVHVEPRTGRLYLVYTEDGYGSHYLNTDILVVDGTSGELLQTIPYTSEDETVYWFPSMLVFR